MKQFHLLVSFILVFNSNHLLAQNDSIYFWKGGIKINQLSIKTADLDSITFKRPSPTFIPLPSVTIGTQTWTTKNLDVTTYSDGTPIPQVTGQADWENLTTGAWCCYNNDPANGAIYGKLYNWYAVVGIWNEASKTDATQRKKLAPTGYHVPSDAEWTELTEYLGGETVAGGKMKEIGTAHWLSPNTDATNSSGFTGLPGGFRFNEGSFGGDIGYGGSWWSSSEGITGIDWDGSLIYLSFYSKGYLTPKTGGFSVRCVRD